MQRHSTSADELREIAREYINTLIPSGQATVITLSGELGAGKTTFSQGMAQALGVEETVSSPTFVIEKTYQLKGQKWSTLIHIDAYRLTGAKDLEVLHWSELVAVPENLILLEWPENVAAAIPDTAIALRFDIDGDGRIISSTHGKED